ncbi:5'-nucleotidase C-terminal domain-containing protein [Alcaligenaceae bacterium C4P045]|nr:5'-nucleotidase C-terminal domain-containing protein [Alcaligenaceae bacterium C4P045]
MQHEHKMPQGHIASRGALPAGGGKLLLAALLSAGLLAGCGSDDDDDTPVETPTPTQPAPEPAPPPEPSPTARAIDLTILHINDQHSNLDSRSKTLQLQNATGTRVAATVDAAGFPRVKTAFDELSQNAGNVLKLHAGDALTGTLYFNRAGAIGEADAAMMNTVCFDAFTLGNHEFDKGDTELKAFIDRLHGGICQTPVLSANVNFGSASALNVSRAPDDVRPAVVVEREGEKIGIVGLTVALKTKGSSSPDPDTTFEEETVAAQRAIDGLTAQGVNKIVLLSHIGYSLDRQVLANLSGVDVVVGGDSHTLLGPATMTTYGVGSPAGAYAEPLKNKDGDTVCLAQAWEYTQVVGEIKVSFDIDGRVTACGGTPHVLIGDTFQVGGAPASAADRNAFLNDIAASGFLRVTAPSAQATAVLAPYKAEVDVFKAKVVAQAPDEICSRRVPGGAGTVDYSRSSAACNALGEVSLRGGDIQQLVAQAYLDVANASYGGADIALQSGGGVRVPVAGNVTAADVIEVLPFGNLLYRLDITGDEARGMIEDGLDAVYKTGGSTGPYPYTGGMRFDVNAAQAKGQRASNIEVFDAASGTWAPLNASRLYKLFVLSFNATGGDGYTTLANVPAARRTDIGVLDSDVFQTYIDGLPKDPVSQLPVIRKLPAALYSTKTYAGN